MTKRDEWKLAVCEQIDAIEEDELPFFDGYTPVVAWHTPTRIMQNASYVVTDGRRLAREAACPHAVVVRNWCGARECNACHKWFTK